MKLGLISLGCAKNRIDSELFLGVAKQYNIEMTRTKFEGIYGSGMIENQKIILYSFFVLL